MSGNINTQVPGTFTLAPLRPGLPDTRAVAPVRLAGSLQLKIPKTAVTAPAVTAASSCELFPLRHRR